MDVLGTLLIQNRLTVYNGIVSNKDITQKGKTLDLTYEPIITKQTGFNLPKSDVVDSTSTVQLATSLAVKTANDRAVTAENNAKAYADTKISQLINGASATLDTLNELAAAMGNDPNFATTVTNSIATKVSKAGDTMTGNLSLTNDGLGILLNGGAKVYKKATAGLRLVPHLDTVGVVIANAADSVDVLVVRNNLFTYNANEIYHVGNRPMTDGLTTTSSTTIASATAVKTLNDNKLGKTETATNSNQLGGQMPTYYAIRGSNIDQVLSANTVEVKQTGASKKVMMDYSSELDALVFSFA